MSLQFILGNSGSGKSHLLYETVIQESMERERETFLVIVPEQFTMETQKNLVELHPRKGILNIDVLSFQRLALRVLEEIGADRRKILEETGKNLVIRRGAMEHKEELTLLGGNMEKPGYIKQVKSMISELAQYNIEPGDMGEILESLKGNPKLYYKWKDIQIIYDAFQKRMAKDYVTAEELLEVLAEHAEESGMLKGCTIALDGYTGFTPIQQKLLKKLLPLAKKVMVTVTVDPREEWAKPGKMHELFYLSKKTIHALTELALETGTEVAEPVVLGRKEVIRFRGRPMLAYLEGHLFRTGMAYWGRGAVYKAAQAAVKSKEEISIHAASNPKEESSIYAALDLKKEISIHAASNPREEIHFAARKIMELTRSGACSYGEIALISGDMETYAREARRVFPKYGIPCFIDETRRVLLNPFLEFIKSALEMLIRDFSYETVFRFLRTGLLDFPPDRLDYVENYCIAAGIRGYSGWKKVWEQETRIFSKEDMPVLNEFREEFLERISEFAESMRGKGFTLRQRTESLFSFIDREEIQQKLYDMELDFAERGEEELSKEYHQIYAIVLSLFDKMVEFLGDEVMSLKDYKEILESGFEDCKVGLIPPSPDEVLVGDMERTRLKNIKVLIFLGLNEGIVPSGGKSGGILSEQERDFLSDQGISLAPGIRENSFVERFYLYLHLTKPSERLYLTLSKSDMEGKAMRPSYVLGRIQRLFPDLTVVDEEADQSFGTCIWTPENGIPFFTEGLLQMREGGLSSEMKELYLWYDENPVYREKIQNLLGAAFQTRADSGIGHEAAKALYGTMLTNSVSRLETFASCAYAHFLRYGLRLSERETLEFAPVDMGNLFHKALELFSGKVQSSTYTWFDLPDEEAERFTGEAVKEAAEFYKSPGLKKDSRSAYALKRIERIMRRTIWALLIQIRSGLFAPGNFEVPFSAIENLEAVNLDLPGGGKMRLRGRIDRVDYLEKDDEVCVRVVDYKSGNTKFDLAALYYGLQLQLVVYLNAAMELEKRIQPDKTVVPAGIFYYHVEDPVLEAGGEETPEKIREQILKELRVSGIVNSREDIIFSMDKNLSGASSVIPVSVNKDGSLGKASRTMNTNQFAAMSAYVNKKMQDLGKEIMEGDVSREPYERKNQTACDYCAFRGVCGFDLKDKTVKFRRLEDLTAGEALKKIEEEME